MASSWGLDSLLQPGFVGRISITLDSGWEEPYTDSAEDIEAAERANQFKLGWFANPIFVNGDYPQVMKDQVARKSQLEGRNTSRLPEFTEAEKARIVGKVSNIYNWRLRSVGSGTLSYNDFF